jgi:hypothetical protein
VANQVKNKLVADEVENKSEISMHAISAGISL